jgi:hypothetical protein
MGRKVRANAAECRAVIGGGPDTRREKLVQMEPAALQNDASGRGSRPGNHLSLSFFSGSQPREPQACVSSASVYRERIEAYASA